MRSQAIALGFLLVVCGPAPVRAQTPDSVRQTGSDWAVGASVGFLNSVQSSTLGLNLTQLRPGRLGGDFSIGTMPRVLVEGVVPLGARAGLALPVILDSRVLLVPSAGVSALGVASSSGGGGTVGLNAGMAVMVFGTGSLGLRTGVTFHEFGDIRSRICLLEFGVVSKPKGVR